MYLKNLYNISIIFILKKICYIYINFVLKV